MCLLVFAWQRHPIYRFVFAGNRDEYHARPAAAAGWWENTPTVLGGRDRQAGGTWLAINRQGRFAVVTNYHELTESPPGAPSRGELVSEALDRHDSAHAALCDIEPGKMAYAGFNLIVTDDQQAFYLSNRSEGLLALDAGIYGLGNQKLDTPWPKVEQSKQGFADIIEHRDFEVESLFGLLGDRQPAKHNSEPEPDSDPLKALLSAPFVISPEYGTRCTTVVLVSHQGQVIFVERRFDADGKTNGESRFDFKIDDYNHN